MIKCSFRYSLLFLILTVSGGTFVFSQSLEQQLKMAKALEQDGQPEKALQILEKLYAADSLDARISEPLKSLYRFLQRDEERLKIIQKQYARDTTSLLLLGEMIDVYLRTGKTAVAERLINRFLATENISQEMYVYLAGLLLENRRFEDASTVYLTARKKLNRDNLFQLELSRLYFYRKEYYRAAQEMLRYYENNKAYQNYVRTQLYQLPVDTAVNREVIRALEEHYRITSDLTVGRWMLDFLIRQQDYDRAFEQVKSLDRLSGKQGIEILNFAQVLFDNNLYAVSVRAYSYFINLYPQAPQAELGLAKCYERMGDTSVAAFSRQDSIRISESAFTSGAVEIYKKIIDRYPDTDWEIESRYRLGMIYLNTYGQYDEALACFLSVAGRNVNSFYVWESKFMIGECYLQQNRIETALKHFQNTFKETRMPELRDKAQYRTAESMLFLGRFDSARVWLSRITRSPQGVFVNDALTDLLILQDAGNDSMKLQSYFRARLLNRQKRYAESIAQLQLFINTYPGHPLNDDALILSAENAVLLKRYADALAYLNTLSEEYASSPRQDLALKIKGDILMEKIGDLNAAIAVYKQIITRFPGSIFIPEVRKKLRILEKNQQRQS